MRYQFRRSSFRINCSFVFLALALILSSCGHANASRSQGPGDAVMKTVREYGSDSPGMLAPGAFAKADEKGDVYRDRLASLLLQGDYTQLEKIAAQNRTEKGRLLGGFWKNYEFFSATSSPSADTNQGYLDRMAILKKWSAAYPESAAARISLARLYEGYAWFARGTGYANSVGDSQWQQFNDRVTLAEKTLLDAATLKERDAHWYFVMQMVAHDQGWSQAQARELLDQALVFEPDYYHYYISYAHFLLPQWYGEEGDVQAFADQISGKLPAPTGSIAYFQIISATFGCYCREDMEELPHASYPKLRDGYSALSRLYGTSNLAANRFALIATVFHDKYSAHEAFSAMNTRLPSIWTTTEYYDAARAWADAP